ncbi:hypothetical protein D9Q98_002719 [Chlorella vulgaris]|uniref:Uncharacterized protein n=1 Tax=Chlorella vulgaris TaxID=3077 RepID=A0A9D4TUB0_CHLVU|nr:hypothetical protein D9Q98_002719 [Chlorella vulgaris]
MSFGGCDEADRLCHDAAEFEGRPGAAYSAHDAPDTAAAAANLLAAFPLLLLGLIGLLLRAGRRRRGHALGKGLVQGLKPRHFSAAGTDPAVAAAAVAASRQQAQAHSQLPFSSGGSPPRPAVPAFSPAPTGSGKRYGMGYGEAESEEEEWSEGRASEVTEDALRHLSQTPEFHAFLKARGMTPADVSTGMSRVRLYRRLRHLDPASFWHLLRPGTRTLYRSRVPSRLLLAAHYLLATSANLAAAAAVGCLYLAAPSLPAAAKAVAATATAWMVATPWLQAQPTAGGLMGLWYEEPLWGHAPPRWRCVAASLLETVYVGGSAGIGAAVSLWLRCVSSRRQSVGELLAGVHVVKEVRLLAGPNQDDGSSAEEAKSA